MQMNKCNLFLTWIVSDEDVAADQVGGDEEEAGREAGNVDREARQLDEGDGLRKVKHLSMPNNFSHLLSVIYVPKRKTIFHRLEFLHNHFFKSI